MEYLDEIGGSANNLRDRIFDIEYYSDTLYWTGSVESGFPTSAGAYDVTINGGRKMLCHSWSSPVAGTAGYHATFYGGRAAELGNGIKQVSSTGCGGTTNTFILVWGTISGNGTPTLNINNEAFYDASIMVAKICFLQDFKNSLDSLKFGTYVGGTNNDYLGNIGDPRGANHLWVSGSNIYVGTTTHSNSGHTPTIVGGGPPGGFDVTKSNGTNDSHVIFEIELASVVVSDFGDAPISLGRPLHTLDCENLYIGELLDDESGPQNTNDARGDNDLNLDDEDGVANPPAFSGGGPQTITVTIDSIRNSTGETATLYAWINLDGSSRFDAAEIQTATIMDGHSGPVTLTWTNVTVSGVDTNKYLRIRLTTDVLADDGSTNFDERANTSAVDGEVEDYRCVQMDCPDPVEIQACLSQDSINSLFNTWLASVTGGGGCDGTITNNNNGAPSFCGETKTVTFTYNSTCAPLTYTCNSTFAIFDSVGVPPVVLVCASNHTEASCQSQSTINAAFTAWLATASVSGGCNTSLSNNNNGAPSACGGSKTVIFTANSGCEAPVTCSAVFTVTAAPPINLMCPSNNTQAACQTQGTIDAAYTAWLNSATYSNGCIGTSISNNGGSAPSACGGSKTVTWTATNTCEVSSCSAVFTVTAPASVSITCAGNNTQASCQTQAAIDAAYTSWLATTTFSGGCNASISNNGGAAPSACGGSKTVTWTVTSSCDVNKTCSAVFTVTAAPLLTLFCPINVTEAACQTQASINTKYSNWLNSVSSMGGCSVSISNNNPGTPSACGGSVTVTFTATSSCEGPKTCSAVFTVTAAPNLVVTCATNNTQAACQTQGTIDAAYAAWLATTTLTGCCNVCHSNNVGAAPPACGGSKTVTWTVTSSCAATVTCSAVFTVIAAPVINLTCATNNTQSACQSQSAINAAYTAWLVTTTFTGGCNATISNNGGRAPLACGGSKTVSWTVTSSCEVDRTCSAIFTVTAAPTVTLNCATNNTQPACQSQAAIDAAYATWLASAGFSGGCSAAISNNGGSAPLACGGSKTVTWTVTSSCEANVTCSAVFTVTAATTVALTCPSNNTQVACQTQAAIDAAYSVWLATGNFTGGCNAMISNNGGSAPLACGGSKTVTWTVTSTCDVTKTCSAIFTVTDAPLVVLSCPSNNTQSACQTQGAIDAAYAAWLSTATFTGGCNASMSNNSTGAPARLWGSKTVT
ncbi:MAG: hypothetical protein IPM92_05395 [Saprospiraceae bacterium]|nr:hypothetical protein [Saprospiraceae bacterium]